jgi:flagellar biosynthesis protein FlhG
VDQAEPLRQLIADQGGQAGQDELGARRRKPLRVIAVTSGKGGVGKTNLSANLGVLAAKAGQRVLLVDADLGLANVEIVLGLKPRYHIGDLLEGDVPLSDLLVEGPYGLRVLPGGSGLQGLTKLDEGQKMRLLGAFDSLEDQFDLVLIDTSAGIGDNVLFFVSAAQEALLVVSPEPTSLVDAYAVVKVLSQQIGVRDFSVIVNPVVDELPAREIFGKLTSVTSRFLNANMRLLGYVPRDENMHRAITAQKPVVEAFPRAPSSRALGLIADKLVTEPVGRRLDGGLKLMWQRLLRESQPELRAVAR